MIIQAAKRSGKGTINISGKLIVLDLSGTPHKFFIHKVNDGRNKKLMLTEYYSGAMFAEIKPCKGLNQKQRAQRAVDGRIVSYGIDRINIMLNSTEKVNY